MRIGVMGAGAVGSYFGALLARAGHEVVLVGRQALVDGVQRGGGLRVSRADWDALVPLRASTDAAALAETELVLVCVKSGDSERAAHALGRVLPSAAVLLSLQNGVDNAERMAALLPQTVVPTVVYVATEMAGPAHVLHHGRGELIAGPWQGSEAVVQAFGQAGIGLQIDEDVLLRQWDKLIINCAYNALSAVTQMPYGQLLQTGDIRQVMTDVVQECVAVAQALGLPLEHPGMDAVLGLAQTMPAQTSSTAQDLARGRPTEIDYLNGYVARKGAELGLATPVNRTLAVMVKLFEARQPATLH